MFNWIAKKYLPIGLDIGHTAVRGIQLLRQGNTLHVHNALEIACPAESASPTELIDRQNDDHNTDDRLPALLERLIDRADFVGRDVVLHCPGEKLDMRPVNLPAPPQGLPRSAVLGALKLQMANHLSFPVEQAVFDYFIAGYDSNKDNMTVMAFTADGSWINQRIDLIQSLGLRCVAVDTLPCVLTRLVTSNHDYKPCPDQKNQTDNDNATAPDNNTTAPDNSDHKNEHTDPSEDILTGILDIGFSGSTLIVCDREKPLLCRCFQLGGKKLTETLSQQMMLDYHLAEKLIATHGLDCQSRHLRFSNSPDEEKSVAVIDDDNTDDNTEIAKTIFAALQIDLNDYVEGLIRTLNYIIAEHSCARLEKILLCGSAGHTKNLSQFFAEQFELPVEPVMHPLLQEIVPYLPHTRHNIGSWTTALGLALAKENA